MSPSLRSAFCSLGLVGLAACSSATPATIQAPDRLDVDDTALTRIDAVAIDETGKPIDDLVVYVSAVSDPSVLRVGHNSELQCKTWGLATVTLEAPPARKDVVVACRLVQELRVAPQRLMTVLSPDAAGKPTPRDLGAFQFQAIGFDGKAIKDAPIEVTATAEGVLERTEDGTLRALKPGRATIHGVIANHTASLEVEVGLLLTTRKGTKVEDSGHLGIPVEAGRYRIAVGSDQEVRVRASGGTCEDHEDGLALEPVCTFETAGTVRIENPGSLGLGLGDDANVTLRVVQVP